MSWPEQQETEWRNFLSELTSKNQKFYLLVYDRPFTYDALFRRMQLKLKELNWQFLREHPSEKMRHEIDRRLQSNSVQMVWVQLDDNADVGEFNALSSIYQQLPELSVKALVLVAQTGAYRRLIDEQVQWQQLPYHHFQLPKTPVPDLPNLATFSMQVDPSTLGYHREQIQLAQAQSNERRVFQMIPAIADLYLDAEMYETASNLYGAFIEYCKMGANNSEADRYLPKLHVAEGWRIVEKLGDGQITPEEQAQLENLLEREVFLVHDGPNGLMLVDSLNRAKNLSATLFVCLTIISEKVQNEWQPQVRTSPKSSLLSKEAKASYEYTANRSGLGYSQLDVLLHIHQDGSTLMERIVTVEAFSELSQLETYHRIPEKEGDEPVYDLDSFRIESLNLERDLTIHDIKQEADFRRLSVLHNIAPKLRRGESLAYRMHEHTPPNLIVTNLTKAEILTRADPADYMGWDINKPTQMLTLQALFPTGIKPIIYGFEVRFATVSGFPSDRLNYAEQRRFAGPQLLEEEGGNFSLKWEVAFPMTGLIYVLWWRPPSVDD